MPAHAEPRAQPTSEELIMAERTGQQGSPSETRQHGDVQTNQAQSQTAKPAAKPQTVGQQTPGSGAQQEQGTMRGPSAGAAYQRPTEAIERLTREADRTAHKTVESVQRTRQRAAAEIADQRALLSGRIRGVGEALKAGAEQLDRDEGVAALFDSASARVERIASYVDEASAQAVASDLSRLARTSPAWFYGGAFLAGLALGRFARASGRSVESEGITDEGADVRRRTPERSMVRP
jgi:hypothetical protein